MRKLSFLILLATVAAPALAAGDNDRGGRHQRNDSSEQSENRAQRGGENRAQRAAETRGSESREQRASGAQRSERTQESPQRMGDRIRQHYQEQRQQRQQAATEAGGNDDAPRALRRSQRQSANDGQLSTNWRERERRVRTIPDTTPSATQQTARERGAFRDRNRRDYRDGNYTRWTHSQWRDWRHDRRYDWRDYRNRHRSSFRIGIYFDPFGWNYRRWSVGSYLYPSFYGSRYWLNDPWQYRLPPAYGPYRWVRYWNDALLVNIYTGEVEDVIHGFFW